MKTSRNNKDLREVSSMNLEAFGLSLGRYYCDTEVSHRAGIVVGTTRSIRPAYVESDMFVEDNFLIVVTLFTGAATP